MTVFPMTAPSDADEMALGRVDAWWRAANYLSVGQIYLLDNPLLREPLRAEHVKSRLVGHWGTVPGITLTYAHLNRVIMRNGLEVMLVTGPGHGAAALNAAAWLEGTYSELYPEVGQDEAGMAALFRQFSFPGGVPSHASPQVPGSIHEGGELGYSLAHATGAAFDNPGLIVACLIGDGEAETGPLAASWQAPRFLHPWRDGAVLPILHLNGYKIANPTVLSRIPSEQLAAYLRSQGWDPIEVADTAQVHRAYAAALDECLARIERIRRGTAHGAGRPMIVLRTPKGWTGPSHVDGHAVEGSWRSHQVPLTNVREDPARLDMLRQWLVSYRPEELFGTDGGPTPSLAAWRPGGERRMSANPRAHGQVQRDLRLPDPAAHSVAVTAPGEVTAQATSVLGDYLREALLRNESNANLLLFAPDEHASNRLDAAFDVTSRRWQLPTQDNDQYLSPTGRVVEVLSEHLCQGWLEGYLLTGRHGLFSTYEAFAHVVDSMVAQHAKWLLTAGSVPWRRPVPSLNYLLTSHVWRQDHNGASHQDPGFIDHILSKRPEVTRVYLPPDANTLVWVADHCLRTHGQVNVIVAGKQPAPQYLSAEKAAAHCAQGLGVWEWASTDGDGEADVVLACAGDVPTMETLAAVHVLAELAPDVRVRVVNVVDLTRLFTPGRHPHGLSDQDFTEIFTADQPVIFAFHGYPWLIHQLTYDRPNHDNLHVHGFRDRGSTTTPFDMCVLNDLDRFHLALAALERVPRLAARLGHLRQRILDRLAEHAECVRRTGDDLPAVRDWTWHSPHPDGANS
ncbi:xylulose-5-phosphate/fructose-6-phosphate phosphoketolase [Actinokineospora alba]|uniref:Xylulose-5-phosphate/fructose-6-phosphate phosphoketolase n=2 Tax=Actinokineospora alba TaxID=504798 RepID=A0A1H0FPQ9_9PSEU|nr:xylulose-5-phosphate/fructose-6-phosphate phosphoketolase [Actinokineospora alba]SDI14068.1 xylulose-5-phosphate/fructose-6-phosphate phosphoketolase [Actinokineospora alba]SDN96620.1 xylulose-5-phosphate/fructose-6-phosphate phosphoketolase [Actinokineospora alba]